MIAENVTYFDSFEVKHIPKEIRKFIGNKNITMNIYRIQAYDSKICGYFCIGFIDFMLKGNKVIFKYFQQNLNKLKCIVVFAINIQKIFK